MSTVTVNIHKLVDGASLGAVRINLPGGRAVILVDPGLTVEEQAERINALVRPGELTVFTTAVPVQRSPLDDVTARVS